MIRSIFFIILLIAVCDAVHLRTESANQVFEIQPLVAETCSIHGQHSHRVSLGSSYVKSTAIIRQRIRPELVQGRGNCSQVVLHVDVTSTISNNNRGQGHAMIVNVERLFTTSNGYLRIEHEGQRLELQTVDSSSNSSNSSNEGHSILTSRPDGLVVSMQEIIEVELVITVYTKASQSGHCPRGKYSCGNNACIWRRQVCDGFSNCGNRSDETCKFKWSAAEVGLVILAAFVVYFLIGFIVYTMLKNSARRLSRKSKLPVAEELQKCHLNPAFSMK